MNKQRRTLLAVIALAAAVFFGLPALKEGTSGECNALSARIIATTTTGDQTDKDATGLMSFFAGPMTTGVVALRYPNIPTGLSCAALYWRTLFDPHFVDQFR